MKKLIYATLVAFAILSCNDDKGKNIPSLDGFETETKIFNIHSDLRSDKMVFDVFREHPAFSEIYFGHILGLPLVDTIQLKEGFRSFYGQEATLNIGNLIDSLYGDQDKIEEEWNKAVAYYHHYFPNKTIPDLYLMQTNLAIANFLFVDESGRDAIGASMDFFLGKAYPYTQLSQENPVFSTYNNRTFNADHLVSKSMAALAEDVVVQNEEVNFMNMMLREGKKLYLMDMICPHVADSVIFEFTPDQLKWCEDNEFEIWNFIIEQELLYENSIREIAKFLNPGPSSPGMPEQAPGRAAAFIGFKIVEAYMDRNPKVDLYDLAHTIANDDLIEKAGYRPRKR